MIPACQQLRRWSLLLTWPFMGLGSACDRDTAGGGGAATRSHEGTEPKRTPAPGAAPASNATAASTLLEWQESAYGNQLFVERTSSLILTPTGVIHVHAGQRARKTTVPLGVGPTLRGEWIMFFHDGYIQKVSKLGGKLQRVAPLSAAPLFFLSTPKHLAWLERTGPTYSLAVLSERNREEVYQTARRIAAATLHRDRILFVVESASGEFRLGSLKVAGGNPTFSRSYQGRTPSMLAAAEDRVYFYDGPARAVRQLSLDLGQETLFAEDVVCSPIAVADRVVCAQVGKLLEIRERGAPTRLLSTETTGPITRLAAGFGRAVWLTDSGEGRLSVRSIPLGQ